MSILITGNKSEVDVFNYPADYSICTVTPQMIVNELNNPKVVREALENL